MSITVNTNMSALAAQQNLNHVQDKLSTTLNRLSSGSRVNTAKDDAAGYAIAQGMSSRIRGLSQGARNGNDGISLIQTTEAGMTNTLSLLQRMRELSTQAASGTYRDDDRDNLQAEYESLMSEIDRAAATTDFNGIFVLTAQTIDIQIGSQNSADDRVSFDLEACDSTALLINGSDISTAGGAQAALALLDTAITDVTTNLATLGANQSNLEAAVRGNEDRVSRLEGARSRIMDTDYAAESSRLAQYQILQQTGAAMLSQANSSAQIALRLVQG